MKATNKQYSIGIDIGGTNIKAVLFDGAKVIADDLLATPKDTLDHFIIMLNALVKPLKERAEKDKVMVRGIGMGVPGVVNGASRIVIDSPNLQLIEGTNIADRLEEESGLKVYLDNDANCFVRGEAQLGAAKGYKNVFGIILGTGIGGGWWYEDKVYRGAHGIAGEPGAMIINFEAAIGLEEAYHKLTQNNPASIAEEAYRGDLLAEKVYDELGKYLGLACANIANLIDPEVFVIGGGVVDSGDLFLKQAKKTLNNNIAGHKTKINILKSKLGKQAGAIGAALMAHNA